MSLSELLVRQPPQGAPTRHKCVGFFIWFLYLFMPWEAPQVATQPLFWRHGRQTTELLHDARIMGGADILLAALVLLRAHAQRLLALAVLVLVHLLSSLLENAVGVVAVRLVHLLEHLVDAARGAITHRDHVRERAEHTRGVPQLVLGQRLGRRGRLRHQVHRHHAVLDRERADGPHLGRVGHGVLLHPHGWVRAFKAVGGLDGERRRREDLAARRHERAALHVERARGHGDLAARHAHAGGTTRQHTQSHCYQQRKRRLSLSLLDVPSVRLMRFLAGRSVWSAECEAERTRNGWNQPAHPT